MDETPSTSSDFSRRDSEDGVIFKIKSQQEFINRRGSLRRSIVITEFEYSDNEGTDSPRSNKSGDTADSD